MSRFQNFILSNYCYNSSSTFFISISIARIKVTLTHIIQDLPNLLLEWKHFYIYSKDKWNTLFTQIKQILLIFAIHTYRYYCYVTLTLHKTKLIPCVRNKNAGSLYDSWLPQKPENLIKSVGHSLLMSDYFWDMRR